MSDGNLLEKRMKRYLNGNGWSETSAPKFANLIIYEAIPQQRPDDANFWLREDLRLKIYINPDRFSKSLMYQTCHEKRRDLIDTWCSQVLEAWTALYESDDSTEIPFPEKLGWFLQKNAKQFELRLGNLYEGLTAIYSETEKSGAASGMWEKADPGTISFVNRISGHISLLPGTRQDEILDDVTDRTGIRFVKNKNSKNAWWVIADADEDLRSAAETLMHTESLTSAMEHGMLFLFDDESGESVIRKFRRS